MAARHFAHGAWVQLQANTWVDPKIIRVGPWGELVFMRSLQMAKYVGANGWLSQEHVDHISRNVYGFSRTCDRLVDETLWTRDPDVGGIYIRQWSKYHPTVEEEQAAKDLDAARKRVSRQRAGMPKVIDVSNGRSSRKSIEERDIGSDRTPSGSVRSEPARAAPRSAEGAAQHPPSSAEVGSAVDEARRAIAEARTKMRAKSNRPVTTGNGKDERVDFSASLAKLTEAAERLKSEPTE